MATATNDAALARKRRMAMRSRQRTPSVVSTSSSEDEASNETRSNKRPRTTLETEPMVVSSSSTASKPSPEQILESIRKKKPHITGIKKQSRYDPGVTMTKEELKAWRKEARRVRNRESAAASRKKNREAIDKLEVQVKEVQSKYDAALQYILDLEEKLKQSGSSSSSFYPSAVLRQDLKEVKQVSPAGEVSHGGASWPVHSYNDSDKSTPYQSYAGFHSSHPHTLDSQKHIIDNTIIRPIACV